MFPEDGLCEGADIRVIPAEALDTAFSSGDNNPGILETIAYGPIDYMARAFLCGCADYLADPWLPEELFLRCGRLRNVSCLNFPGGSLRYTPFALHAGSSVLPLSEQEYRLLRVLARRANSPVPRRDLLRILGYEPGGASSRLIDVHIASLRAKLRSCGLGPPFARRWNPIRAVRGIGYGLSTNL